MANIAVDAVLQLVARDQMELKAVVSPNKSLPFLIAAQEEIATPADLQGASFGVGRIGSLDHSLSTKVLEANGIAPDQIEFVNLGQPDIRAQALAAGQVDATTMSIGVWMSLPDQTGLHVLVPQDAYYAAAPVVNKVNVVPDEVLAAKREQVEAVVRALVKASRDFAANPEQWVEAMAAARPDVDRANLETLAETFAQSEGAWSINGGLNREELEFTSDWVYQGPDFEGLPEVGLADWVDFSVVDAVLASEGVQPGLDEPVR
jgi:NitT/TauT family transport system substrate-binding protein